MAYWYNLDTGLVETDQTRGQNANVMGPYDTQEQASRALEIARERTEKWDEQDRDWDERGASPSWSDDTLED